LRPAVAVVLLIVVIAGWLAAAAMNRKTSLLERIPSGKPPDFLVEHAREFLNQAGYPTESADSDFGYYYNGDFLNHIQLDNGADRWDKLADFSPILFVYRHSPRPLERSNFMNNSVGENEPPLSISGDVSLEFDNEGRLRYLEAIPPELESQAGPPSP